MRFLSKKRGRTKKVFAGLQNNAGKTTMIYTHAINQGGNDVRRTADY